MAIVAIAAMAAFNLNINAGNDNLSAISMDNIEILAWGEGSGSLGYYCVHIVETDCLLPPAFPGDSYILVKAALRRPQ